jgi:hypothetical protein
VFGDEKTQKSAPSQRCSDHCRYSAKVSIEGAGKVLLSHAFAAVDPTVIWISPSFRRWRVVDMPRWWPEAAAVFCMMFKAQFSAKKMPATKAAKH